MFCFAYLMIGSSNKNCNEFSQLSIPWPEQAKNVQSFWHLYIQFRRFRFVAACIFSVDYNEIDYVSYVHSNQSQRLWTEVVQHLACIILCFAVSCCWKLFLYFRIWVMSNIFRLRLCAHAKISVFSEESVQKETRSNDKEENKIGTST